MKKIYIGLLIIIVAGSCKKLPIDASSFEVSIQKTTIKAGDSAFFNLSGYADYISFYSGKPDSNYDRINTYTDTGAIPEVQFTSNVQFGTTTINNLTVFVSSNFNGKYDTASVSAATWTNVTSRFVLGTSATNVASGIGNMNDLKVEGKPMYVAFRYLSSTPATLKQRQWTVGGFLFRTRFASGKIYTHAADNTAAGFLPLEFSGDSARWVAGTSLTHVGLNAGMPGDEDWAISKSFDLSKSSSDAAGVVTIKNLALSGNMPSVVTERYTKPGNYKAVFVFRNANREENASNIKSFNITVTP